MKPSTPYILPACFGLLALASAGSAFANSEPSPSNSIISISSDYYTDNEGGGDQSLNLFGGTLEYGRVFNQGGKLQFAFTALSGTSEYKSQYDDTFSSSQKTDATEFRLGTLYSPPSLHWLAVGLEYIHEKRVFDSTYSSSYKHMVNRGTTGRPDFQWDGTYDTHVSSYSDSVQVNNLLLKSTLSGPNWHLYRGQRNALSLMPSLDTSVGCGWRDEGDGTMEYIVSAKAKLSYDFGANTLFLEGGYRRRGSFEYMEDSWGGCLGRLGYAYSW